MTAERPLCVLIAALGGQGGGVLADWLVEAARNDGFPAQATSIPGVAQRTGATTYYLEIFPDRAAAGTPVFSLYPCAGDVDLVVALEPTEAGRALMHGFVDRRTTVVTALERVYSTAEKMPAGDGTIAVRPILDGLRRAARGLIEVDVRRVAGAARSQPNAVMFGAVVEAGGLPVSAHACRTAITAAGVAAEANLAGFAAGAAAVRGGSPHPAVGAGNGLRFLAAPAALAAEVAALPVAVQAMAAHGAARLVDYQDLDYARLYLERLARVIAVDGAAGTPLSLAVARRLAAWMAFEDVIRVAQLKTRPGRLARIRSELGVDGEAPLTVIDFLKPGREEIEGLLPAALAGLLPAARPGEAGKGLSLRLRTSAPIGYGMLRLLAATRPWRRRTVRFRREQAAIERWLAAVVAAAPIHYAVACDAAETAVWARGYGEVRARGLRRLAALFDDWEGRLGLDPAAVAATVRAAVDAAYNDPDGEIVHATEAGHR